NSADRSHSALWKLVYSIVRCQLQMASASVPAQFRDIEPFDEIKHTIRLGTSALSSAVLLAIHYPTSIQNGCEPAVHIARAIAQEIRRWQSGGVSGNRLIGAELKWQCEDDK
ncbi:hypothetical protein CERSUDRAFT_78815, partial [Gelatoporia subvermispora B]